VSKIANVPGQRFGLLTIIKRVANNKWGRACWLCLCDCGNEVISSSDDLNRGDTKSCGCTRILHGHNRRTNKSQSYRAWDSMIQRCTNSKNKSYHRYGGRGITVCQRWMQFEYFIQDMGEPPTDGYTLDKIDNNDNYYKENCRWATMKEQARNRRNNKMLSHKGTTMCLTAWAEKLGVRKDILSWRLNYGWSTEKTLTTPVQKYKKNRTKD